MEFRSDISPSTLGVEFREEGIAVTYLDGRTVVYRREPEEVEERVETPPGKEVHVLVTDPTETEGVMMYVNDHDTHDEIIEATGVGRVLVDPGETEELFPGVAVTARDVSAVVEADPEVARGRVFVFAEDATGEFAYEITGDE